MRIGWLFNLLIVLLSLCLKVPACGADELPSSGVFWGQDKIVALGQGIPPDWAKGTGSGKLLAKRAAMVDLQRNLLEFIQGVKVQSTTVMADFMVHDHVVTSVQGAIKGVQIIQSQWDGEIHSLWGTVPMKELRGAVAQDIPSLGYKKTYPYDGKGYDSLVIDLGNQPFIPSMVISVVSKSGRKVYDVSSVDRDSFIQKGMFRYVEEEDSPKAFIDILRASPAWADSDKALVLNEGVELKADGVIVISDRAAALIEKNSFDFRVPCNVTITTKASAVRGLNESFTCYLPVQVDP